MSSTPHLAGQKIRQWREQRGLSAREFGELVDPDEVVSEWGVYHWEVHGKIAHLKRMNRLAEMGVCEMGDWLKPAEQGRAEAA